MEDKATSTTVSHDSTVDNGKESRVNAGNVESPEIQEAEGLLQSTADHEATTKQNSSSTVNEKKRGRPRRKTFDDAVSSFQYSSEVLFPLPAAVSFPSLAPAPSTKRPRGRPKGSGKYQTLASHGGYMDTAGGSFTPHVMLVKTGEDLVSKMATFCVKGARSVCVLTATGAVSSVTLYQPGASLGTLTYEGQFEILTLIGSSVVYGELGTRRKNSMLSVSLANSDGRVFGGSVVGPLIAAGPGPIQVIMASFKQNLSSEIKRRCSMGCSTSSAHILDSSEMASVPVQVAGTEDGYEKYCTPPVTVRQEYLVKLNKVVADNHDFNSTSPQTVGPNKLQKAEKADNVMSSENQHVNSTSLHSDGPNNLETLPVSQPISDEMITPDTNASDHEMHVED